MDLFTGEEYLKIDIASNFGLEKETWQNRIKWFDQNESKLDTLVGQAEEPALFYAGMKAWRDVQAKQPIGYMISLDATSSGLQILAALTGDKFAAQLCNVVDTGKREDAYTLVYQEMLNRTGGQVKLDRDQTKDAIMTSLYGSTAIPKLVFGEGKLLDVFYQTMLDLAPAAWELNQVFLALWNPDALVNSWILPDNFHVHVKVMEKSREVVHFLDKPVDVFIKRNLPIEQGRSLGANTTHSIDGMIVREITRRCGFSLGARALLHKVLEIGNGKNEESEADQMVIRLWELYQISGYLSSRILEFLNAGNVGHVDKQTIRNLLNSLPERPFKVVSIHDCFRCLPHYGNDLRREYNLQLAMIARSNLLGFLLSQIVGRQLPVNKLDPHLWTQIENTNYALS